MNHCDITKDLMPLHIDRLCSETSSTFVEQHLSSCQQCKQVYEQMLTELNLEQIETKETAIQQKQPFVKMNNAIKSYRYFTKLIEWLTVIAIVSTLLLAGKGFVDTSHLNYDLIHQSKIEKQQEQIMEDAFNQLNQEGLAGLQAVSLEYGNYVKYIAVFKSADVDPLPEGFKKPKAIYPLPYEKALATYENGQLVTGDIIPNDYDIGTMVMEKDGYIVQFEYAKHHINEVERAFQTKHYSPTKLELWLPALISFMITLCLVIVYRGLRKTNKNVKQLME
mgnify:CR=1 FL=1